MLMDRDELLHFSIQGITDKQVAFAKEKEREGGRKRKRRYRNADGLCGLWIVPRLNI